MRVYLDGLMILFLSYTRLTDSATSTDVERLFQDKIDKSNPNIRPVRNQNHSVGIEFAVYIVALTDVNEVQQKIEATMWLKVQWTNELLRWNKSYYGNLDFINPPVEKIWRPDLSIINGYNELNPVGLKFVKMKINHNGLTTWTPGQKAEFLCEINVAKFPFDTQNCYMDFFNWGDTENETTLSYFLPDDNSRIQAEHPNSEWTIQERKMEKRAIAGNIVRVRLILKRKPISMVLTVLLPVFLLSFLNIFVFLLPTESGEKLSFSVTVLLSQAVFLSFISGLMPQTSVSISGLSIYISCQLILSTFYVLLTCCILTVYHRNTTKNPLPSWFIKILCFIPQVNDHDDKKLAFDNLAPSGVELSQKLDRACFWIFLFVVVFMTSYFMGYGLTS